MATKGLLIFTLLLASTIYDSANSTRSKKNKARNFNGQMSKGYEELCPVDKNKTWSYNSKWLNGPEYWGETFPTCYGQKQSPINIITSIVTQDRNLKKLELNNYDIPLNRSRIENNGYIVKVTPNDGVNRTVTVNGLRYSLDHFLFHWSHDVYTGSEHKIYDQKFAMELQFVHSNSAGQLAVVGVLYQSNGESVNVGLETITKSLKKISFQGMKFDLNEPIELDQLVKNGCSFYRYNGSLTTPPCSEGVIWSICKEPIIITWDQIYEFLKLFKTEENDPLHHHYFCQIGTNVRPTQPLYGRTVVSSA